MEIRIKLKIKDIEIKLSQEEATELQEMLCKLTGAEQDKITYVPYPYKELWPLYPQPRYWTTDYTTTKINANEIRCLSMSLS